MIGCNDCFNVFLLDSIGIGSACRVIFILLPPIVSDLLWVMHNFLNSVRRVSDVGLCVENASPMRFVFISLMLLLRIEIMLLMVCRSRMFLAMHGGSLVWGNVSA